MLSVSLTFTVTDCASSANANTGNISTASNTCLLYTSTYICIEVLAGAVRGTGDSLIPTLFTLTGVCLLRVAWVMGVAPAYHSLTVVLLSYPITWTITSVLFVIYYLKGGWLKRSISKAKLEA